MAEVLDDAIPFFVLLLIAEYEFFRHRGHYDDMVGYYFARQRDVAHLGIGNVIMNVGWKLVVVAVFAALYELTPTGSIREPAHVVALFFADDPADYWFHRSRTRSGLFRASDVVDHSSRTTTSLPRCGRRGCR